MSHETSKALRRRMRDPRFATQWFVGRAIDIGSGQDSLARQMGYWPLLTSVDSWDRAEGDAAELRGVTDNSYDLVYSSHCLEHVSDPQAALARWFRVTRPDGHLIVVVPDREMYERNRWPSAFNPDHKTAFTVAVLFEILLPVIGHVIKIERLTEHFDPSLPTDYDQTQGLAECAIEFVVRKP